MAYATLATASRGAAIPKSSVPKSSVWPNKLDRRGLFRRMLDAIIATRQRQADREIARYSAHARRPPHRRHRT